MLILGLSAFSHESAAVLLLDGRVIAFVEEERLNREKHTAAFPERAIRKVFKIAGLKFMAVDQITFFWRPGLELRGNLRLILSYFPQSLNLLVGPSGSERYSPLQRIGSVLNLKFYLDRVSPVLGAKPVFYCPHHLAHAASSFYLSPFKKSAILTLDGRGEATTSLLGLGEARKIKVLYQEKIPHSLGLLYSAVTDYLGFKAFSDEGKVMGLSAYGDSRNFRQMKRLVKFLPGGRIRLNLKYFRFHTHGRKRWFAPGINKLLGQDKKNIAKALQLVLEQGAVHAARHLYRLTRLPNLCLAGGVALNCLMTRKIREETGFKNIFVVPTPHDAGAALGSALYFYHRFSSRPRRYGLASVNWGPAYSDRQIKRVLTAKKLPFKYVKDISSEAAKLLAGGKIIAWFQGRMEAGPRALGNRSILADPRQKRMKAELNRRVKHREWFRPFAPSVLTEEALNWFDTADSPYMISIARTKTAKRRLIPAVTHIDGTARLQTVSKKTNPRYWRLINHFFRLTGVPVVLNTSLNDREPIACSPEDAVRTFLGTNLDYLAIGHYLVSRPQ